MQRVYCCFPEERGSGGLGERGEGINKYKLVLQNGHRGVTYSIGNIVKNIMITMYGARWVLKILGGTLCKVYDCLTTMLYT